MIVLLFLAAVDGSMKSCANQCDQCGKYYKTPQTLRYHKMLHSEPKCVCSICMKIFYNPSLLSVHRRKEHCNKEYKCQLCDCDFQFLRQLDKHLSTKHGPKRFKFEFQNCNKSYIDKHGLTRHQILHTGLKPYTCDICGKSCNTKGDLKSHSDVHSDVKEYKCDICGRCFSHRASCAMHVRRYTKEHKATLIRPAISAVQCHE